MTTHRGSRVQTEEPVLSYRYHISESGKFQDTGDMIMDDVFGFSLSDLPLGGSDTILDFETEIDEKNIDMDITADDIPQIKLEELDFDFEDMKDFGPWIETDVVNNVEPEKEKLSDRLNFKDIEIKEAVRYDCMWSSYNEFNMDTSRVKSRSTSSPASDAASSPTLPLSNSFYDSLLNSFETPSCTESDNTSDRSSDMDTDEDSESLSENHKMYTNIKDIENNKNNELSFQQSARLFASLDHSYFSISNTQLDNEKFINNSSGPLTPPMSSDDEDNNSQSSTNFKFDRKSSSHPVQSTNKCTYIRTKASNVNKSNQSLLKKSYTKASPEAKFSFKLNLKTNDAKNRSLLKQRIGSQKVKIIKAPFKADKSGNLLAKHTDATLKKNCQSAIRKRKERSLKMQEGEAREMHNQMERQRRNELKLSFDKLKTVLPELATSDKASKQQILDKAVETVQKIRATENSLAGRVNVLNKNNAALKEKLRLLKQDILNSDNDQFGH